jgi:hypothetical protein
MKALSSFPMGERNKSAKNWVNLLAPKLSACGKKQPIAGMINY